MYITTPIIDMSHKATIGITMDFIYSKLEMILTPIFKL
jgi:hypothetical protein